MFEWLTVRYIGVILLRITWIYFEIDKNRSTLFWYISRLLFFFKRIHIAGKHLRAGAILFEGRYGSLDKLFKPMLLHSIYAYNAYQIKERWCCNNKNNGAVAEDIYTFYHVVMWKTMPYTIFLAYLVLFKFLFEAYKNATNYML